MTAIFHTGERRVLNESDLCSKRGAGCVDVSGVPAATKPRGGGGVLLAARALAALSVRPWRTPRRARRSRLGNERRSAGHGPAATGAGETVLGAARRGRRAL